MIKLGSSIGEQVADVKAQIVDVKDQVTDVKAQVADVKDQVTDVTAQLKALDLKFDKMSSDFSFLTQAVLKFTNHSRPT